jgi:CheY-like chemotaxis protein
MAPKNCFTFFVLDDDPVILKFMVKLLEAGGHAVHSSSDSLSAIKLVHELKPDCLITDLVMPGRDGLDVVGDLRDGGHNVDLKIIMVTTRTKDIWKEMARKRGVDHFIHKPIDGGTFVGQVIDILSSERH